MQICLSVLFEAEVANGALMTCHRELTVVGQGTHEYHSVHISLLADDFSKCQRRGHYETHLGIKIDRINLGVLLLIFGLGSATSLE
jgi:hypothetical protein